MAELLTFKKRKDKKKYFYPRSRQFSCLLLFDGVADSNRTKQQCLRKVDTDPDTIYYLDLLCLILQRF